MARLTRRLVPLLVLCYFAAYLDRVNVGFAKLEMSRALGLSETVFGLGAGLFFLSYFAFEVPSNLALDRLGARVWIARIMLTWGILSGAMAFTPHIAGLTGLSNTQTFYFLRLLLGAAEAGFFPGIILYLTLWFPAVYRARIVGLFMAAVPLSSVIGSPVSGYLLGVSGWGLVGWQWLFILEALPAILLAFVVLLYLTDRPAQATWLADDERDWLTARLEQESARRRRVRHFTVLQSLTNARVLGLALVYFGTVAGLYGVGFFLPTIVKGFGLTDLQTGWVTAIPYLLGSVGMVLFTRHSDKHLERKGHMACALIVAAAGFAGAAVVDAPVLKMALLCLGSLGVFGALPVFWTLPTAFLTGTAAAAGIAIINALGNLAGFLGPFVMGWLKDTTGSFGSGLLVIAACAVVALVVVLLLQHDRALERVVQLEAT
ncbi:MAG: MFS transporter [Acetobacteraceae bacterium]|nr:MFS transporter [Acetobacteraceae bacterium]